MLDPDLTPRPELAPAEELPPPRFYVPLSKPIVTRILMGILLAVFMIEVVVGLTRGSWTSFTSTDPYVLFDLGAKENGAIRDGQFWRLLTATLLHSGILHLLFNLYALFALGPQLEAYFGHVRFAAIYLLSGLCGSLASYAFSDSLSVGASGAIFGLVGATTVYFFKYRDNFGQHGRSILQNMIFFIAINLVFGLSSGFIDNWGHMGGLIGGAVVAYGLLPRYQAPAVVRLGSQPIEVADRRVAEFVWVTIIFGLFLLGVYLVTVNF